MTMYFVKTPYGGRVFGCLHTGNVSTNTANGELTIHSQGPDEPSKLVRFPYPVSPRHSRLPGSLPDGMAAAANGELICYQGEREEFADSWIFDKGTKTEYELLPERRRVRFTHSYYANAKCQGFKMGELDIGNIWDGLLGSVRSGAEVHTATPQDVFREFTEEEIRYLQFIRMSDVTQSASA